MLNNIIVRLVIYYLSWLVFLAGAFHFYPRIQFYVAQERDRPLMGTLFSATTEVSEILGNIQQGLDRIGDGGSQLAEADSLLRNLQKAITISQDGGSQLADTALAIPIVLALTLAFGVTLPVTWVYRWTRPQTKYSQSFIQALLVTPIGIALVVFLVKGSLTLALGLAGIVAAVRFRATMKEPMDAVYMLMAIGIGLAAGTQLTTVAYLSSLIFVGIVLAVWKSNYGAEPAILSGWRIVSPAAQGPKAKDTRKAAKKNRKAT